MKQIRDAIVIGSGILGAATALALTRAGMRRVTLLEKGPLVSGMTRRSAGLVHPFQAHPILNELASASYDFYSQWATLLGGKSSFVETGAAVLADADPNPNVRPRMAEWAHATINIHELAPAALSTLFPGIPLNLGAALYTPRAGYADAVLTTQALVNAAKERGLEVQTGTQAKQILVQQKRIHGVLTTTGEFEAPTVIVTAGGWSERLLGPLGVTLHFQFRRGIVAFYEQPPALGTELPLLVEASGAYFFRPHPYRMSAAGVVNSDGAKHGVDSLEEFVSPTETLNVSRFMQTYIPAFANVPPKRAHPILYVARADGLPVLGRIPTLEGLYVAAGFGTGTFSVAPAVGETIAQLVIDGNAARDVSSFSPLRAN